MRRALTGRLLVAQVAVVAAVLAHQGGPIALGVLALPLVVVAVALVGRYRGRSAWRVVSVLRSYRRRQQRLARAAEAGERALTLLAPDAAVRAYVDRAGTLAAVTRHESDVAVVLALTPPDREGMLHPAQPVGLPLDVILGAAAGTDGQDTVVTSMRLLLHSVPRTVGDRSPARRLAWVSLRLDLQREDAAVRRRGGGITGAMRALAMESARLAVRAAALGVRVTPLDPAQLRTALAIVTGVEAENGGGTVDGEGGAPGALAEYWGACRVGDAWHTTYWLRAWPTSLSLATAVEVLSRVDADSVSVAVETEPGPVDLTATRVLVRTTAPRSRADQVDRELREVADEAGLSLVALDGCQALALAATTPVGGSL